MYSLSSSSFSHGAGVESGSFGINSQAGCSWTGFPKQLHSKRHQFLSPKTHADKKSFDMKCSPLASLTPKYSAPLVGQVISALPGWEVGRFCYTSPLSFPKSEQTFASDNSRLLQSQARSQAAAVADRLA